ncbi:MAG: LysM domain protein [Candidatus Accumulibacter appositus]|uniref:LysM domain protein n=1 Tax=Candidatus Accumulibacter appositus TaxID=1454003 RepID=A0A011NEM4_9PROT|nr:LysM domain-containing protein [Accumulibacter sp.]EXI81123.1 MAG: LysM domain protein [Candidatus Accumulibacter appositus]HRF04631.1 LysM domain-containing protein [Accumulibacter sp.]
MPVWRYTVRPGDTLIGIAERYLIQAWQWPRIQRDNKVDDPHRMLPGMVLRIPAAMLRRAPAEAIIATVTGVVRWRAAGSEWQPAASGQRLASGRALETLDDASVLLRLAAVGGGSVACRPATTL